MSQVVDFQVSWLNPSVITGPSTAVQYFPRPSGSLFSATPLSASRNFPSNSGFLTPSATSAAGQLAVPSHNRLNGQLFTVVATGVVTSGGNAASETVEIALYANTSSNLNAPSYMKIATTGAVALNPTFDGVANSWYLKAELEGDSLSGIVGGVQTAVYSGSLVNGTPKATIALSSINFDAATAGVGGPGNGVAPPFGLVVGVQFSQSSSGNTAYLYQFQIIQF
jgi:hypothetical protein